MYPTTQDQLRLGNVRRHLRNDAKSENVVTFFEGRVRKYMTIWTFDRVRTSTALRLQKFMSLINLKPLLQFCNQWWVLCKCRDIVPTQNQSQWFPSQMLHLKPHQKSLEHRSPFSRVPLMITVVWFMFPPDWPNVKVAWKNAFGGLNAPVRRLRVFLLEPVFTSTYCDNSLFLASQTRKLTKQQQPRGAEWVELLVSGLWMEPLAQRKLKEAASEQPRSSGRNVRKKRDNFFQGRISKRIGFAQPKRRNHF